MYDSPLMVVVDQSPVGHASIVQLGRPHAQANVRADCPELDVIHLGRFHRGQRDWIGELARNNKADVPELEYVRRRDRRRGHARLIDTTLARAERSFAERYAIFFHDDRLSRSKNCYQRETKIVTRRPRLAGQEKKNGRDRPSECATNR